MDLFLSLFPSLIPFQPTLSIKAQAQNSHPARHVRGTIALMLGRRRAGGGVARVSRSGGGSGWSSGGPHRRRRLPRSAHRESFVFLLPSLYCALALLLWEI